MADGARPQTPVADGPRAQAPVGGRGAARDFYRFAASAHYEVEHANPNHADVVGWPAAKQDQKAIALVLAASAVFVARTA